MDCNVESHKEYLCVSMYMSSRTHEFLWGCKMAQAWLCMTLSISAISSACLSLPLSDLAWLHPADVLPCCSWTQYHSKHTHSVTLNPCHIPDAVWGPWCRKQATWGPKSSMVVGWLYNLIAWIVSFFFFVVKFLFFCSFLASSCAAYSCQTSTTSPDITARLLGDSADWLMEHITLALNFNGVIRSTNTCDTAQLIHVHNTLMHTYQHWYIYMWLYYHLLEYEPKQTHLTRPFK